MYKDTPKQAFAVREAHQALLELKKIVDGAIEITHIAELESFHLAAARSEIDSVRTTLQETVNGLTSPNFEGVLSQVRQKLETAASL